MAKKVNRKLAGSHKSAQNVVPFVLPDAVGVSRYKQLATLFRRHISTGHWKVGEQIPTIEELAESHGVARANNRGHVIGAFKP